MTEMRILSDHATVTMLQNFLRSLVVYKQAEEYVLGHNSYYVESCDVCLIYLDKRIHYGNRMYELRGNLAVVDCKEHVDIPNTATGTSARSKNSRWQVGTKLYQCKTYTFVENIWNLYLVVWSASNAQSTEETSADKKTCQSEDFWQLR